MVYAPRVGIYLWGLVLGIFLLYLLGRYVQRQLMVHKLNMARISPEELKQKINTVENLLILDVRNPIEYHNDPRIIPGARLPALGKI